MYTVGELKKLLADLDDDMVVVQSKDSEGNGYSPLSGYSIEVYAPVTTWYGELWHPYDDEDYWGEILDPEEHVRPENAVDCIVLWPTN